MERSVRDSAFVLVICTEKYKNKFDHRTGGVGYEGHIITGEIIRKIGVNRFIPVLRRGDWDMALPTALDGVFGVDLRSDSTTQYRKLVSHLQGNSAVPPVGAKPSWLKPSQGSTAIPSRAYADQLNELLDTDIMKKIWAKPRWRIWSGPEDFKKARFRDLDDCERFVASANVRSNSRWTDYPWFLPPLQRQTESIAKDREIAEGNIKHWERWALFRSAQFVHNMAFDEVSQLGKQQTHVLEILDTITAAFEFLGRMADKAVFTGDVAIAFDFHNVAGRQLTWPGDVTFLTDKVKGSNWCQDESFTIEKVFQVNELRENRRSVALDAAFEIYSRFQWNEPLKDELESVQRQKFGPPRRS